MGMCDGDDERIKKKWESERKTEAYIRVIIGFDRESMLAIHVFCSKNGLYR